jgi:hypothetical protein
LLVARLKKYLRLLDSLKVAIPLLVLLIAVSIVGSLFPGPDWFWSWWYLGLLGLLGLSLLFVTVQHIPAILKKKGRNALIGVISTHLGILVLIVGVIYGGFTGFRHQIKLIEGEVTIVPGLPFAVQLDELVVEEYRQEDFPRMNLEAFPKKTQDSRITLLKSGSPWLSVVAAPGRPAKVNGITLLPSLLDTGWYFEILVVDRNGRTKTIPVRPWAPPLIQIGDERILTHSVVTRESPKADFFVARGDEMIPLGTLSSDQALEIDGNTLSLGRIKRYTGMKVYNRPHGRILVWGTVLMFAGLVWHFYFRHRDHRREGKSDA